uniref:Putative transport protein n=1 Tax=Spirogyra maxima TaxID=3180 RepID=A0A191T4E2_SPIMX|nr:putative transport protein [Spirogyra maxima]ANI25263.1 putative transport protein [Spirogyra maxima]
MSILVYKLSKLLSENVKILDRVSLYVAKGSLAAILGPSGSGKSSLLRSIAGLDIPLYGSIWLNGRNVTHVAPQYRKMGFVFQNYALFKHMTVQQNIEFGLRLRKLSSQTINHRVNYLLNTLRIKDVALQYPFQLSGGQKQRVALARSLAIEPEFLLLDEPFRALDGELRRFLSKWLKSYLRTNQITTLMVTHDQKEAISMADEIMILKNGRLVQQGKPQILYDKPLNQFVGRFLGPLIATPNINNPNNNQSIFEEKTTQKLSFDPVWSRTFANRSIEKFVFFFRSYEVHLQRQNTHGKSSLAFVQGIIYAKELVQLELLIVDFSWKLTVELGYKSFKDLHIKSYNDIIYVQPRSKVFPRAYHI